MNSSTGQSYRRPEREAFQHRNDASVRGWLRRHRATIAIGGAVLSIIAIVVLSGHDDLPAPRRIHELSIVNILQPPPPPPPPPPPEQKMIEQTKVDQPEFQEPKPVDEPQKAPIKDAKNDQPPGPLSLDAKAQGPGDLFNLGGKPGGNAYGGSGGGSGWGWYASMVQSQLRSALEAHKRTRKATMRGNIRLWADQSGRVTRVQLNGTTGDAELDAVLRNEVFGNLTLREPPPKGMPMPMIIRITEQRPS
ncbi:MULTISPECIES: energy transducer TonB [unclassified Methylosinus]|uniref:energy transducer TonB n=1 Tax=unclassified Methylosinus TaxID=2624500 RepID=UPI00046390CD|nr:MULTISPECIES: energy transducer TonB [unclassified Methylosinus]